MNPIETSFYRLVLANLKYIFVNGFFSTDEVRYIYSWDNRKSINSNLKQIRKEEAVLRYFLESGVIDGMRIENAYRNQELQARKNYSGARVWEDWDDVDPAYREYDWIVLIHGLNANKFEREILKFGLLDTGIELISSTSSPKRSPPLARIGAFSAHKDGHISHMNQLINLKPEVRRLVFACILKKGHALSYVEILDALWGEDSDSQSYLDNPTRSTSDIRKRIGSIVSEANRNLFTYGDKKHLINSGETSYRFDS